jgi:hypothetical protein
MTKNHEKFEFGPVDPKNSQKYPKQKMCIKMGKSLQIWTKSQKYKKRLLQRAKLPKYKIEFSPVGLNPK